MNDPGLDEPISDAQEQVKEKIEDHPPADHDNAQSGKHAGQDPFHEGTSEKSFDSMSEEEQENNVMLKARWWYASTGIPLVAGTFGPMANAFSICALVENWRVSIPTGGTEQHGIDIKDPRWLIAVNAVSLTLALIANAALLLNMARRVPFQIAQPVTILGFWIASILLIGLIANASSSNSFRKGGEGQALTQAYYYAIFAAGIYQVISYLMCITVYGAYKGHYSKEFKLTVAQRTLMLQTISFLTYLLLGALIYSHIEGWKFLDAVYWADFTSLTIGIGGSYTPKTHLGRGLLFPFAMGAIIILGLVVGSIRSLVLERGKKKLAARLTEKTRVKLLKEIQGLTKKTHLLKKKGAMGLRKDTAKALTIDPGDGDMPEVERRQAEFDAMRKVQEWAATQRKYMSLTVSTFAFAFLWFIGALVFQHSERNQDWSYFQALYFSYTSLLTIGYGDFEPMSNSGKPFFVFWSLLAIPTLTILISDMGDTVVKAVKDITIWLGEVTVLPSDEDTFRNRVKHGVFKATLGQVDYRDVQRYVEKGSGDSDGGSQYEEMHPGLARLFRNGRKGKKKRAKDLETVDHLAADFEKAEEKDENDARKKGNKWEEDEHHYRHELIAQLRRVYADTQAATPKTYTYEEWQFFLRLLGEEEDDPENHRKAPTRAQEKKEAGCNEAGGKIHGQADASGGEGVNNGEGAKWSWIGARSPLMGDKDEAEWLLERFFQRLEDSLHEDAKNKGPRQRKQYQTGLRQARQEEDGSSRSDGTASRG